MYTASAMPKSPFTTMSERNLLIAHNTIAARIKCLKRFFIKKGEMMKTFDYINSLHQKGDYIAIDRVCTLLEQDITPSHRPQYFKIRELINYCVFLDELRYIRDSHMLAALVSDMIDTLNIGHELGRAIERRVRLYVT